MKPRKEKIFAWAKGFQGRRKNCFAIAVRAVHRAWATSYKGRKLKKRDFRKLWIQRISAGVRQHGMTYSEFIQYLPKSGIQLNRKVLADLAATEPYTFRGLIEACRMQQGAAQLK